jgi:acyl-CoA reductase-like NAD-dependent aldehyde dehydrogenase
VTGFDPGRPAGLPVGAGWVEAPSTRPVRFPYDGSPVADAPVGDPDLAYDAVTAAADVAAALAAAPAHARRATLLAARDAVAAYRADLADLLVLETGKPLADCRAEVTRAAAALAAAAEEIGRPGGGTEPPDLLPAGEGLLGYRTRHPVGVVAAITPFTDPLLVPARTLGAALAAGCPAVLKPAPQVPLAALWLVHLLRSAATEAGVPAQAVQAVTGGAEVGEALATDGRLGAVAFTGSTRVGHAVACAAAPTRVLLDLGSTAALVVAADADLDAAADAVVRGGFHGSGQACTSVQRVLVAAEVRGDLLARILPRVAGLIVGDPRNEDTNVSPLIDARATERVRGWLADAIETAGDVLAGGTVDGRALRPTVLADVRDGLHAWDEEILGPVVCVRTVAGLDDAVDAVNRSGPGLHASVFTRSLATALAAVDRLHVAHVAVNEMPGVGPPGPVDDLTTLRTAVIRPA